ncbi:MAG: 1-(5-phosphoribosyl)-5-[(5-phosphoribosylamino)methylideneamino] imidazole-4-carboxamide isomerase [bacterium]|nr:1-(5-phosphoribosyl)-5-[(5-phosphoribosylamino)methylideneamino] imidazole-4-carboxamide isomerase [bacterium]MCY3652679.1 1-(5-phosphoribosyl)-5-[(5-phosphoribosylamino)methylideneamino] imidazole-4-carboxamide isomerase [bacterium]
MRIYPAIDILENQVVRLFQGDYGRVTRYGSSIEDQLSAWKAAGAGRVHVIDLDGARLGRPNRGLWDRVTGQGVEVQLGGGIRTLEVVREALESGVDRVIMGTGAVRSPGILRSVVERTSSARLVAAIDVKSGRAGSEGWTDPGRDYRAVIQDALDSGVGIFLVTAIARDGTLSGPDLDLLQKVRTLAPAAELMAAGGIACMEDLDALAEQGVNGAVIGKALYEGGINLTEALRKYPG